MISRWGNQASITAHEALYATGHTSLAALQLWDLGPRSIAGRAARKAGTQFVADLYRKRSTHIWKIKRRKMLIIKINSHLRFLKKFRVTEWVVFEMSVFFYWFKHFILSHFTNHLVTFLHKQFLILIRCFRFDIYLKSLTIALPSQFIISYFLDSKKPL